MPGLGDRLRAFEVGLVDEVSRVTGLDEVRPRVKWTALSSVDRHELSK